MFERLSVQLCDLLFSGPKLAHSRSQIRPVPPVPCKRKVEPCKFLSVQTFVRTRVNGELRIEFEIVCIPHILECLMYRNGRLTILLIFLVK